MKVLSYSELDNLVYSLNASVRVTHPIEFQYLNAMYDNGLRVSEVTNLQAIVDDGVGNLVFPALKRSNERIVPRTCFTDKYLSFVDNSYEFYCYSYPKALTRLMQNVRLSKSFLVGEKLISTHLYRHRYIKYLYTVSGLNAADIQLIIGHKSVNTTMRYITSKILTY